MKKVLINNKEDFYRKLYFYKSIFYRNTEFCSNINDEELQSIIKALNIKQKRDRIEFIYDYCCDKVDEFYKEKDLCLFNNNKCINQQKENCVYKNGCCRICLYQSKKGCTTKNLSCKLFYCDNVKKNNKTIKMSDLKILKLYSLRQRLMVFENYFTSREEFLKELNVGLLIFHSIGIVKRIIKNSIYLRKNKM